MTGTLRQLLLLDLAALRHAQDLLAQGYYSHISVDGSKVRQRAEAAGFRRPATMSENLAKGLFSPAEVVERWLDSKLEREDLQDVRGNGALHAWPSCWRVILG